MIHLSTDARLKIILPNTNKALAEAIKSATPEQLVQIREGKDIKSLITSVFQEKITASKSDQALLQILKNAPAFKNMGNFSDQLGSLAAELKNVPDLARRAGVVENFLKNFTSLNGETLKSQLAQSGVFMESKIAQALQTLPSFKETLQSLHSLLSQSARPGARELGNSLASLLQHPSLQTDSLDPASAKILAGGVQKIAESLRSLNTSVDVLYSKEVAQLAAKIEALALTCAPSQEAKPLLSQLYGALLSSNAGPSALLLDGIEQLLKPETPLPDDLQSFSRQLGSVLEKSDPIPRALALLPQLGTFADPDFLSIDTLLQKTLGDDLKSQLLGLSEELQNTSHPKAAELLEQVDKLLTTIDYHQLVSHLGASNSIYFPFSWDLLDEGSLAFKKGKEQKFYCEINLRLKEYGELNLMMALYDENRLDIQAHTETSELKERLSENLPQLRAVLIDAGLVPKTIRIFEMREKASREQESYSSQGYGNDFGFEVKV
ncbi:MAG: flagellar hook-length control protein FliK [Campylobacterales bacterium]|nr:flagellar hook-length control protein FliK [Campylobacterales bacterium]